MNVNLFSIFGVVFISACVVYGSNFTEFEKILGPEPSDKYAKEFSEPSNQPEVDIFPNVSVVYYSPYKEMRFTCKVSNMDNATNVVLWIQQDKSYKAYEATSEEDNIIELTKMDNNSKIFCRLPNATTISARINLLLNENYTEHENLYLNIYYIAGGIIVAIIIINACILYICIKKITKPPKLVKEVTFERNVKEETGSPRARIKLSSKKPIPFTTKEDGTFYMNIVAKKKDKKIVEKPNIYSNLN